MNLLPTTLQGVTFTNADKSFDKPHWNDQTFYMKELYFLLERISWAENHANILTEVSLWELEETELRFGPLWH